MVVRDRECGEGLMVEKRKVEGLKGDHDLLIGCWDKNGVRDAVGGTRRLRLWSEKGRNDLNYKRDRDEIG